MSPVSLGAPSLGTKRTLERLGRGPKASGGHVCNSLFSSALVFCSSVRDQAGLFLFKDLHFVGVKNEEF